MRQISDTKWLRQIVMPGSHDAGVYGTAQTITRGVPGFVKNPTNSIVCQHSDFGRQAMAGSRFFDCRVFLRKTTDATGAKVYEQKLGHFFKEKVPLSKQPAMGGYGGALTAIVGQALDFVIANPSEFIILRFSHTYHPTECVNAIQQVIASNPAYPGALYTQTGNIATKTIGSLRKKVIMVFDEKFNHHITPGQPMRGTSMAWRPVAPSLVHRRSARFTPTRCVRWRNIAPITSARLGTCTSSTGSRPGETSTRTPLRRRRKGNSGPVEPTPCWEISCTNSGSDQPMP